MSTVTELTSSYTMFGPPPMTEIVLVDTPGGWMWFAQPLHSEPVGHGGPYRRQRVALEEAMGRHPDWQLIRIA